MASRFHDGAVPLPGDHASRDDPAVLEDLCRTLMEAVRADGVAVLHGADAAARLLHAEPDALAEMLRLHRGAGLAVASAPDGGGVLSLPLLHRERTWGAVHLYRGDARPWTDDELALARLLADIVATLVVLAGERDAWQRAWRTAHHTATHDHLTGLPNRGLLFDRLDHAIANGARSGRAVAVLFVDVDDFKTVNDRFGHAIGDVVLVEVARRLGRALRVNDTLARLSGGEFVVVCEDMDVGSGQVNAWLSRLGERIFHELRRPPAPGEPAIDVSVSIGAAVTTRDCSAEWLTNHADEAMYAAKRAGGGRLVVSRSRPASRARHWKQPDPAPPLERETPMDISVRDAGTDVVTLAGNVTAGDLVQLRLDLVRAVEGTPVASDLLIDARGVTGFAEACLPALVAARSRAKWQRQSLGVIAGFGSPVEARLRSSGHLARIAVYDDLDAAREALRLQRARRKGLRLDAGAQGVTP